MQIYVTVFRLGLLRMMSISQAYQPKRRSHWCAETPQAELVYLREDQIVKSEREGEGEWITDGVGGRQENIKGRQSKWEEEDEISKFI